ncbi:MAG: hypothetical protein M0Z98_02765 [Actinomycetales bacterium]|nr:hypothetical protein [Actinomycetales bacterium]
MWRLSGFLRLLGLALYVLGLAAVWTLWGLLILCGVMLVTVFRMIGVSLVGFEHAVAAHRHGWRSAVRALAGASARRPPDR